MLGSDWMAELEDIRNTMLGLRTQLAAASASVWLGPLWLSPEPAACSRRLGPRLKMGRQLREDHGIYMVSD